MMPPEQGNNLPTAATALPGRAAAMVAVLMALVLLAITTAPAESRAVDHNRAFIGYKEEQHHIASSGGEPCSDAVSFCPDWAEAGECTRNPGYMHTSCRHSCGLCDQSSQSQHDEPTHDDFCEGCPSLELQTRHGDIVVTLREDWAPETVRAIRKAAAAASSGGAGRGTTEFYRAEKVPLPGAVDNFGGPGPPYALLQGRIPGMPQLQKEGSPLVKRGMVCLIGQGPDFFIAVGGHPEWGNAHTVWGQVADMSTVDFIVESLPIKEQVWGQTHVTALQEPVPFKLRLSQ